MNECSICETDFIFWMNSRPAKLYENSNSIRSVSIWDSFDPVRQSETCYEHWASSSAENWINWLIEMKKKYGNISLLVQFHWRNIYLF